MNKKWEIFSYERLATVLLVALLSLWGEAADGVKSDNPIYEDPFDIAAGGASLTRSSRNGVIWANPALMPYGGEFHRWLGNETSVFVSPDSANFLQDQQNGSSESGLADLIETLDKSPVHFGFNTNFAWTLNNAGLSLFNHTDFDFKVRKYGDDFLPSVRIRSHVYTGLGVGVGLRVLKWLSLGVTAKALGVVEPDLTISVTDTSAMEQLSDPNAIIQQAGTGFGVGADLGLLLFFQGRHVDYRLALKVDDVGNTTFTPLTDGDPEASSRRPFQQINSAGLSMTLHNFVDAIHLSIDYRDLDNTLQQDMFRRLHAGTRILIREMVGLGMGLYDGYPSYGIQLDFFLLKLGAVAYTREMGESLGDDPRNVYQVFFSSGF